MSAHRSAFLNDFAARGHLHQCTDVEGLDALMSKERVAGYIGFDSTAPSLHIGNLTQIMRLRVLQRHGHKPIVVVGGGTTKIGDPSGKDESRQLLTEQQIMANSARIREIFTRYLKFGDGPSDAILVDNSEWLDKLEYIPFLRDVGRHFTINRMVTMDSVKLRLEREQPLTFLEFNYMILQAYDFAELNKRYGCRLQMGGSDQWGNIVVGIDLARRLHNAELYGLTSPLITTSSGAKMGKSVAGAVWLSADMLSPYDFWQYWRNAEDADVGRFLRIFTDLPVPEIERLEKLQGAEINDAKKILANEVTALAHGRAEADRAAAAAQKTFEGDGISADLPTVTIKRADLAKGIGVLALFTQAGLTASNSEARRQIAGGGLKVNDRPVTDEKASVGEADLTNAGAIKLSLGKKKHVLVRPA
ncbi:MAG: tyrosine--tRNA ligase [Alphaproteobacteria bacterium]|nr:tyrosine--tRNA ligase [Alphaproteobacteria bacterium]